MGEVLHADQTNTIGACFLIGAGAVDHVVKRLHTGVGTRNDRQGAVIACFPSGLQFADTLRDADKVVRLAPELRRQQRILQRQCGDPGTLQLGYRAHGIERITVAVVSVGNHRQPSHPTDTGGLFRKLAERDQGDIRCRQYL